MRRFILFVMAHRDPQARALVEMRDLVIADRLEARLYTPRGAPDAGPVLLYFHGGGFAFCDLDTHDALCARLADAGAMRVLSCAYRRAPEHAFPAQRDDAVAAAHWLIAHAAELGADPARLAIGGDSAGGYLAEAALRTLGDEGQAFAARLLFSAMLDQRRPDAGPVARMVARMVFWAVLPGGRVAVPSMLAVAPQPWPPAVIVAGGGADPCRKDAMVFAERLTTAGGRANLLLYRGMIHGFGNFSHASGRVRAALDEIGRTLRQTIDAS